jgi:hypothetical protein
MLVGFTLQNLASFVRFNQTPSSLLQRPQAPTPEAQPNRSMLVEARRQLFEIFEALLELDKLINGSSRLKLQLPVARSEPALAINVTATAATLQSTDEINATPTSFTPFGPAWDGASTALLTIDGAYDGSNGSGTLSFEARTNGVHGQDRLRIRVRDPLDAVIANITIQPSDPLDQQYSLNNGLFFTLGAGSLVNRDTTAIQVFDNIGSVVIPGNAFNGVRNASANLQYGLPAIVDGAFQINGSSMAVNASDTLDAVIDRISQSSAGVTANFNSLTESIEFTQNMLGADPTITIANDSSNFGEISKLTGAVVVPGIDADPTLPLVDVAEFAGVLSGDMLLNSTPVSVDPATDSLEDVIDRINTSGAGVVASFDSQSRQVTLTATPGQNELEIDSNGTALFGALNLPEGKVDPEAEDGGISKRRRNRINTTFGRVVNGLNEFYSDGGLLSGGEADIQRLRSQLEAAIAGVFGAGSENFDSGIGLRFNRDSGAKLVGNFAQLDRRKLGVFLEKRDRVVRRFFNGDARSVGFTAALSGALEQAMGSLSSKIGTKGTLFDAFG